MVGSLKRDYVHIQIYTVCGLFRKGDGLNGSGRVSGTNEITFPDVTKWAFSVGKRHGVIHGGEEANEGPVPHIRKLKK